MERLDAGIERQHLVVDDRGDPNVIDVVGGMEGMALDVVRHDRQVKAEALEEHDRRIEAGMPGGAYAFPKPVEVGLIKGRQIKPGLPVLG